MKPILKLFQRGLALIAALWLVAGCARAPQAQTDSPEVTSLQKTIKDLLGQVDKKAGSTYYAPTQSSLTGLQSSLPNPTGGDYTKGQLGRIDDHLISLLKLQPSWTGESQIYRMMGFLGNLVPLVRYMDPRTGARAYSSVKGSGRLHQADQVMKNNGFDYEKLMAFLPGQQAMGCNTLLYQYSYSDPAVGYIFAYLTPDPNGERPAGEPSHYRVSWSPNGMGYVCEQPLPGLVPLYRFDGRNPTVPGNPYIGFISANPEETKRIAGQGKWLNQVLLGYVLSPTGK